MEFQFKCPYCDADNCVEQGRERFFCSACGEEVHVKYSGGVKVIYRWQEKVSSAETYMDMEQYDEAERILMETIKEYPQICDLYQPLAEAITKRYTEMYNHKKDRVLALADKAIALAPHKEARDYFINWKKELVAVFEDWVLIEEHARWREKEKTGYATMIAYVCLCVGFVLFVVVFYIMYKGDPMAMKVTTAMSGAGAVICGFLAIVSGIKFAIVRRRRKKLTAELAELNRKIEENLKN